VRPRMLGKVATVFQMITVLWILLRWDASVKARWTQFWIIGTAFCTGGSGLLYVWDGVMQLSASPSSVATPKSEQSGPSR
jgi:phosphatidylglycerophosphate synthase